MCPSDDSHLTLEFADHFVIKPTINFTDPRDYLVNALGEAGKPVPLGFDYSSNNNPERLNGEKLMNLIKAYL
jgi:UDP-N-acetylglucosamine 4,6-dehydratase